MFCRSKPEVRPQIKLATISTLSDVISSLDEDGLAELHIMGVGTDEYYIDSVLDSLHGLTIDKFKIFWYCGRGYLNEFQVEINKFATPIFKDAESNTHAILIHLNLTLNEDIKFLLQLASDYKRVYEQEFKSGIQSEWVRLIDVICDIFYQFSREIDFITVIKKMAVELNWHESFGKLIAEYDERFKDHTVLTLGRTMEARKIRTQIERFSKNNEPILILGQTGTGKEFAALDIHKLSNRCKEKFIAINCADFEGNPDFAKSRLFGHAKGAYTGANSDQKGLFEICEKGTLFLDEFAELPLSVQAMLLRVLETKEFQSLGSSSIKLSNARIIAATNKSLSQMIFDKKFRDDLYYRVKGLTLNLPPLKDRIEDAFIIASNVLKSLNLELKLSDEDKEAISDYHWPGNFRELKNMIKSAYHNERTLSEQIELEKEAFAQFNLEKLIIKSQTNTKLELPEKWEDVLPDKEWRKIYIKHVFNLCGQNYKKTSELVDLSVNTVKSFLN